MDILTITMDNTFDGQINKENGKYRSSKRDDFGVGLTSIQAVAHKCGGDARFEADGGRVSLLCTCKGVNITEKGG